MASCHATLIEKTLSRGDYDFPAKYLAAKELNDVIRADPKTIPAGTVNIIEALFRNPVIRSETQAYFLFKELSSALCGLGVDGMGSRTENAAFSVLFDILENMSGHAHRAAAEAVGALPFRIYGPVVDVRVPSDIPVVPLDTVFNRAGVATPDRVQRMGRNLVFPLGAGENGEGGARGRILVLKTGDRDAISGLYREARWMGWIGDHKGESRGSFHVPRVILNHAGPIFKLDASDSALPEVLRVFHSCHAAAYITNRHYFIYPNDSGPGKQLTPDTFQAVMLRNAEWFGKLTAQGVIHLAPIPLFHNRVQQGRRRDGGLYEWQRAGRLDRWLESCRYPNFGVSGLRDFEHFTSFTGMSRMLYPHVGTQLLSLLLVTGSYFRSRYPDQVGLKPNGDPVDVRHLFDKDFLQEVIRGIFDHYYEGFCGRRFFGALPVNIARLSERMVEEMGVDRYMDEILRVADQQEMERAAFDHFLEDRGYDGEAARRTPKGKGDIALQTGPHLGGFNQAISLPEVIEAVETMTSLCMLGKYCREAGLDPESFSPGRIPIL